MDESIWRIRLIYSLYFLTVLNLASYLILMSYCISNANLLTIIIICIQLIGIERLVFDVFGQMWITCALNALSVLTSILGIVGIFFRRKTAVLAVSTY